MRDIVCCKCIMDNINMNQGAVDDISTYQGAIDIFRKVNCVGQDNCIIGAVVDKSKSAGFTGAMMGNALGPVGYVVGGVLGRERDQKTSRIYDYFFALLNFTEVGVGIMPLAGACLKITPEKLRPDYDGFVFYYYQELADITAKNFYGIRKSVKTVTITLANKAKLCFTANMEEKALPYQINGMNKFVGRYQK